MSARWQIYPISEQEQIHLASTTTTTHSPSAHVEMLRRSIGGLIRQEPAEMNAYLCYYKSTTSDSPIPYLCTLGCCSHGCCDAAELAQQAGSFGWALGLLVAILAAITLTVLAMFALWTYNKLRDQRAREERHAAQQSVSSIESSSVSQISGPTTFYHQQHIHPYDGAAKIPY